MPVLTVSTPSPCFGLLETSFYSGRVVSTSPFHLVMTNCGVTKIVNLYELLESVMKDQIDVITGTYLFQHSVTRSVLFQ